MPIRYERDDRRRRIAATSEGAVAPEDVLSVLDRQASDGAWSYATLYDARASADVPTAQDLHDVVLRVGQLTVKHGRRGPVALVVGDPVLAKMGRRYASLGDLTAMDVRVFSSVEEAEQWLDDL